MNHEYNFFKMKCEVISKISRTPFFPLSFRQKLRGLYMRKYGIYTVYFTDSIQMRIFYNSELCIKRIIV
jgi:hypothetical protein